MGHKHSGSSLWTRDSRTISFYLITFGQSSPLFVFYFIPCLSGTMDSGCYCLLVNVLILHRAPPNEFFWHMWRIFIVNFSHPERRCTTKSGWPVSMSVEDIFSVSNWWRCRKGHRPHSVCCHLQSGRAGVCMKCASRWALKQATRQCFSIVSTLSSCLLSSWLGFTCTCNWYLVRF